MKTRMRRTLSWILVVCMILMLIPYGAATAITFSSNAVQMISAGGSHTLMIRNDGSLWAWGLNGNGQLGDGTTANKAVPTPIGGYTDWIYVSAGGYHSLGIRADGSLWAWGSNAQGQIGNGGGADVTAPTQITTPSGVGWVSVSAGALHSLAIATGGALYSWGDNGQGQLGRATSPTNAPGQVGSATWSDVSAGGYAYWTGLSWSSDTA